MRPGLIVFQVADVRTPSENLIYDPIDKSWDSLPDKEADISVAYYYLSTLFSPWRCLRMVIEVVL